MSRILFAWELGSNLGHLARDLPLARACRDAGHEVLFAASDLAATAAAFSGESFTLLQAPRLRRLGRHGPPPINHADLLMHEGFADAAGLRGALAGWRGLFAVSRPDVLVYNHAPTALLAARESGLRVMLLGTGFEIPPARWPLPSLRPWQPIPDEALRLAEQALLSSIRACTKPGTPALHRLTDLFSPGPVHLTTFAELDPFGPRADAAYVGPVFALPTVPPVKWEASPGPRIFAYLRPSIPGVEHLLAALQDTEAQVICAVPNLPEAWPDRFRRLRFMPHAVALADLLPQADLAITYGAGTIATALLAGVPVLVVPQVVEQYLAGLPVERIGAGLMLREQRTIEACAGLLQRALEEPHFRTAARAFAERHADFDPTIALQQLIAGINPTPSISRWTGSTPPSSP